MRESQEVEPHAQQKNRAKFDLKKKKKKKNYPFLRRSNWPWMCVCGLIPCVLRFRKSFYFLIYSVSF
jgi:hypothetical protein